MKVVLKWVIQANVVCESGSSMVNSFSQSNVKLVPTSQSMGENVLLVKDA